MSKLKNIFPKVSFQHAIASTLVLGQMFAIMPVVGVCGKTASDLKFSWTALRTIYSSISFVLSWGYFLCAIYTSFSVRADGDIVGNAIFILAK